MSAWMIMPLLFSYLLMGIVTAAIVYPEEKFSSYYDENRVVVCVVWPIPLLYVTLLKGIRITSSIITKYLTK